MEIETTNEAHPVLENVKCCKKNPNHEEFYDILQLSLDILPEGMRTDECLSYIRYVSETVVRLSVKKPDGTFIFGSGFVLKFTNSDTFYIQTNHHVIGCQDDVKNCTIDFFYNSTDMNGAETSRGVGMVSCDEKRDVCRFTFHPIPQKLKQLMSDPIVTPPATTSKSVIVISHPHGGPKKLTVGKFLTSERDDVNKYIHTAKTCPGSSGGRVINSWFITGWQFNYRIHCAGRRCDVYNGESVETSNVNQSVWWY